jgi:hypothetical protein
MLENARAQFATQGLIGAAGSPEGGAISPATPTKSPNFS